MHQSFPKQSGKRSSHSQQRLYAIGAAPSYPSAQQIQHFLSKSKITETELGVEHVEMLLRVLELDGEVEKVFTSITAFSWSCSWRCRYPRSQRLHGIPRQNRTKMPVRAPKTALRNVRAPRNASGVLPRVRRRNQANANGDGRRTPRTVTLTRNVRVAVRRNAREKTMIPMRIPMNPSRRRNASTSQGRTTTLIRTRVRMNQRRKFERRRRK